MLRIHFILLEVMGTQGKGMFKKKIILWYENKVEGAEIGGIMLDRKAVQVMAASFI